MPILANIFQMGWNHQPVYIGYSPMGTQLFPSTLEVEELWGQLDPMASDVKSWYGEFWRKDGGGDVGFFNLDTCGYISM